MKFELLIVNPGQSSQASSCTCASGVQGNVQSEVWALGFPLSQYDAPLEASEKKKQLKGKGLVVGKRPGWDSHLLLFLRREAPVSSTSQGQPGQQGDEAGGVQHT